MLLWACHGSAAQQSQHHRRLSASAMLMAGKQAFLTLFACPCITQAGCCSAITVLEDNSDQGETRVKHDSQAVHHDTDQATLEFMLLAWCRVAVHTNDSGVQTDTTMIACGLQLAVCMVPSADGAHTAVGGRALDGTAAVNFIGKQGDAHNPKNFRVWKDCTAG